MDNVEKNIIDILTDNHLITTGWTAYESVCLHYNNKTLIIKQYGGQAPDSGVDYLRVQIMAIALNPLGARDILQSIYNFFSTFFRGCTPYSKSYTGYEMQVTPLQSPFELGTDGTKKQFSYALNLEIVAVEQGLDLLESPAGEFLIDPADGMLLIDPAGA